MHPRECPALTGSGPTLANPRPRAGPSCTSTQLAPRSAFARPAPDCNRSDAMNRTHTRAAALDANRADPAARTVPATIASETPVRLRHYVEVLRCDPAAVDLSRAPLPVLEQHDRDRVNIAVAENVRVQGGRVRADIRFGTSARARELFADVTSGIVRSLSIGYEILEFAERGEQLIATRWRPFECSVVSVPADPEAGFYRDQSTI